MSISASFLTPVEPTLSVKWSTMSRNASVLSTSSETDNLGALQTRTTVSPVLADSMPSARTWLEATVASANLAVPETLTLAVCVEDLSLTPALLSPVESELSALSPQLGLESSVSARWINLSETLGLNVYLGTRVSLHYFLDIVGTCKIQVL